jgi:hypothetical protein
MNWPEGYTCRTCSQYHTGVPFSFAADFPDPYANLSKDERDLRATIGSDQCILDSQSFFLRGIMEIPVIGSDQPFLWGVWASIREEVFDEISDCWELEGREKKHGPYKGRLANSLSIYPETLNLKLKIIVQPVGVRPRFVLEDDQHVLAAQQKSGISVQQAVELASFLLHSEGRPAGHSLCGHVPGPTCRVS